MPPILLVALSLCCFSVASFFVLKPDNHIFWPLTEHLERNRTATCLANLTHTVPRLPDGDCRDCPGGQLPSSLLLNRRLR